MMNRDIFNESFYMDAEDPELHVEGFGVLKLSQIKNKIKSYVRDISTAIEKDEWNNVSYFVYKNGVLPALIETVIRYEKQLEKIAN